MTEEKKPITKIATVVKYTTADKNILKQISEPVTEFDDILKELIEKMSSSLYFYQALGISAIQIGVPKRLFLIRATQDSYAPIINPEILESSEEKVVYSEGCLSFPGIKIPVERSKEIKVKYQEVTGEERTLDLSGIQAVCFAHEFDHLSGLTFLDRISKLKQEIIVQKMQKLERTGKMKLDEMTVQYIEELAKLQQEGGLNGDDKQGMPVS